MPSMTKIALYVMIGSVILSAMLGIIAILSGDWGWYELRILLTTITISGASICMLACIALWERRKTKPLPLSGMILSVVGAALLIYSIWGEVSNSVFWELTIVIIVYAVATSHLCLLSLARLSKNYMWSLWSAYLIIYGLASIIAWIVFFGRVSEGVYRFLGVFSILAGSVSILIPIFQRFSASGGNNVQTPSEVKVLCPHCGNEQTHTLGEITCEKCKSVFVVRMVRLGRIKEAV